MIGIGAFTSAMISRDAFRLVEVRRIGINSLTIALITQLQ